MSAPIGDAKSGGVGTLPPPQEQKRGARKTKANLGTRARPSLAWLACPALP